jgi:hypothetical protein
MGRGDYHSPGKYVRARGGLEPICGRVVSSGVRRSRSHTCELRVGVMPPSRLGPACAGGGDQRRAGKDRGVESSKDTRSRARFPCSRTSSGRTVVAHRRKDVCSMRLLAVLVAILAGCTPSLSQEWGHQMDVLTRQNGRVDDVSRLLGSPPTRCEAVAAPYPSIGTSLQAKRLMVHSVIPGGPAEQAGLRPGDTITSVGGQPVANPEEVSSAVRRYAREGQPLELGTSRGNLTLLPKVPKAEQCYWDVQAGQVSRSDPRPFRASCRVNDGFLSTCEWN